MSNDNTQDKAEPSPASAGSRVVAWAVVNPSGGTRFLGLTNEDAQREATTSERVVPVHWPTLTAEEREAIKVCESVYSDNDMDAECWRIAATLRAMLKRLA
jgi:hypothetical protein